MRTLIFILALATAACAAKAETLIHDGVTRTYDVRGTAKDAPTLLVLHGGTGSSARIQRYTKLRLAQQGWTVIYPDGLDGFWNDGRVSLQGEILRQTDDVGFLRAIVDRLVMQGRVDRNRVFAMGVSNGGAMTQRLVCQAPDLLAGAFISVMQFPFGLDCPPGPALPMMFVLGTEDPLVPLRGGPIGARRQDRGKVLSADETLAFYANRNGCQGVSEKILPDKAPDDGVRLRQFTYSGCVAPFQVIMMEGGGHVWPGRPVPRILKRLLGNAVFDAKGADLVEGFLIPLAQ